MIKVRNSWLAACVFFWPLMGFWAALELCAANKDLKKYRQSVLVRGILFILAIIGIGLIAIWPQFQITGIRVSWIFFLIWAPLMILSIRMSIEAVFLTKNQRAWRFVFHQEKLKGETI